MIEFRRSPDMINYICAFLDAADIGHLQCCCKELNKKLGTKKFWRHFVSCRFPNVPLRGIKTEDVEWKAMAVVNSEPVIIRELQLRHLCYRLKAPSSDKDFLRFFCRIETNGVKEIIGLANETVRMEISPPPVLLACSEPLKLLASNVHQESVDLVFKHAKKESVLWWKGHENVTSKAVMYTVDRRAPGNMITLFDGEKWTIESLDVDFWQPFICNKTLLGRSQYEEIGRLAHNYANHLIDTNPGRSYAYTTAHSAMRNSTTTAPLVSTTRNARYTEVAVDAVTSITFRVKLQDLYNLFCTQ